VLYDESLAEARLWWEFQPLGQYYRSVPDVSPWTWRENAPRVADRDAWASNPEVGVSLAFFGIRQQYGPRPVLLDVYDFAKTAPLRRLPLGLDWGFESEPGELAIAGDTAAAVLSGRVFPIELKTILPDVTRPVRFEPKQSAFVLASAGQTRLRYAILGGKPPFSVTVDCRAYPGGPDDGQQVTTDSADGAVEVELDSDLLRSVAASHLLRRVGLPSLAEYRGHGAGEFEALIGRRPEGIAVPLAVTITAADDNNRRCQLGHWIYLDVPLSELRRALASLY
jgi:hypothetical protein